MRIYTAHLRTAGPPILLLREGLSLPAALLGPLWLLARRAWLPAAGAVLLWGLALAARSPAAILGVLWAQGVFGGDLARWSLARQGYETGFVVLGRDADAARARLLGERPDLARRFADGLVA